MADALVRPARSEDAAVLARLQLDVWQQAYSELLPAAALLADPGAQTEIWSARLAAPRPRRATRDLVRRAGRPRPGAAGLRRHRAGGAGRHRPGTRRPGRPDRAV